MKYFQEGNTFYACGTPITVAENGKGETHVYSTETGEQLSESDLKFGRVFGGGREITVKNTSVVMKSGFLWLLAAGSEHGCVEESAGVSLEGGMIGGYLYGGGIGDKIGKIRVKVAGGAVKYGFFGAGNSMECGDIAIEFTNIICTNVKTGSRNPEAVIGGHTNLTMSDGHVLVLTAGGGLHSDCVNVVVSGGFIEKQIVKEFDGKLQLALYENLFVPDGFGGRYPMLPDGAEITYLPTVKKEEYADFAGDDAEFFDQSDGNGRLVFRFFELRHPEMPYSLTPFPAFIGDCCLITFPNQENMLVDTGMPYSWNEINEGLTRLGIKRLDRLVLTHAHTDHIGNASLVIEHFDIGEIWVPDVRAAPGWKEEGMYLEIFEKAHQRGIKIVRVGEDDVFRIGGTEILLLNPVRQENTVNELNENSIAFKLTFKNNSALLCGDISDKSEARIAEKYGDKLKTDMLKVAHHGIVYQSYYAFIDCCKPRFAVVPSMRDRGVFLKTTRYALKHVNGFDLDKLYVTGRCGKIKVVMDGTGGNEKIFTQYGLPTDS
ncbi:MAG: ComEC/Rec2 family competence protein [Eubacteriales bacterium]